jgi:anti-sigma regulatory factor (Ser/Thr protein kinase)
VVEAHSTYEEELNVPADATQLERIGNFVSAIAAHCGYDRGDRRAIVAAVHEAASSAMVRDSSSSRDTVCVRALCRGGKLVFYVRGRGARGALQISI